VVAVEWPTAERGGPPAPEAGPEEAARVARQALAEVTEYLAGERREFSVPVDWTVVRGFTRQVLEACAQVPFGRTVSYGELAGAVGCPRGARAVGQALGRNPAPMIVPCHRVLAAGGRLGGFGGGLERKQRLLELERDQRAAGAS
jgi:methylated-DNA-[protein]-cysteine S-methyltransferase